MLKLLLLFLFSLSVGIAEANAQPIDEHFKKEESGTIWGDLYNKFFNKTPFGRSYAIVIGVSNYAHWNDLNSATTDPLKVRNFLVENANFDEVITLTNEKASKQRIDQLMLEYFPEKVGEFDRFIFYFSGHGTQRQTGNIERGYLVLSNSKKNGYANMISMRDIQEWSNLLRSKRQALFILDSCFSGMAGIQRKSPLSIKSIERLSQPGHHLITAGTSKEESIASKSLWGGSLFTNAFIKGASGRADTHSFDHHRDGIVSLKELVEYIGLTIDTELNKLNTQKIIGGKYKMSPQLTDLQTNEGEFFFISDVGALELKVSPVKEASRIVEKVEQKGSVKQEITIAQVQESFNKIKTPKTAVSTPWANSYIEALVAEKATATIHQITPLRNNKILIGMEVKKGGESKYHFITRITEDGQPDESFGNNGLYKADWIDEYDSLKLRPFELSDGSVIYIINALSDLALVKLQDNGKNDNWLSSDIKLSQFYSGDISIRETKENRLIIGGQIWDSFSETSVPAIRQYFSDGKINDNYQNRRGGVVIPFVNQHIKEHKAIAIDAEGGAVIYGKSSQESNILLWVSPEGETLAKREIKNYGKFVSLSADYTDDIYLITKNHKSAGNIHQLRLVVSRNDKYEIEIAPLSFLSIPGDVGNIQTITRDRSGRWLIAADDKNHPGEPFLFRLTKDGKEDISFGEDGKHLISRPSSDVELVHLSVNNDGKVISVISTTIDGMDASVIYRYNVNGEIDKEFGNKGKVHVISDSSYYPISAHVDPKGAIYLLANQNDSVRLFKFDADGHYDDHFGLRGVVTFDSITPHSMSIDKKGKILIVGSRETRYFMGSSKYSMVARINPNGRLDNEFGDDGIVSMNLEYGNMSGHNYAKSIATLDSGKILIGAKATTKTGFLDLTSQSSNIIAILNDDGTADATFWDNGIRSLLNDPDLVVSPGETGFVSIEKHIDSSKQAYSVYVYDDQGRKLSYFSKSGKAISFLPYGEIAVASIVGNQLVIDTTDITGSTRERYLSHTHQAHNSDEYYYAKIAVFSPIFAIFGYVHQGKLILLQARSDKR